MEYEERVGKEGRGSKTRRARKGQMVKKSFGQCHTESNDVTMRMVKYILLIFMFFVHTYLECHIAKLDSRKYFRHDSAPDPVVLVAEMGPDFK